VQQILVNLLRNGADAVMERGAGTVGIAARALDGGLVAVDIVDDGAGIAAADLPRVFDPFFTTKAPGHGTGLGLAVTWRIVQRLGGRVSVESAPGQGTTVHLELPAADG
jgi:two-component system NtrC family sensor kinase